MQFYTLSRGAGVYFRASVTENSLEASRKVHLEEHLQGNNNVQA